MTPSEVIGVRPGEIIADKYRVERILGQGGMGVVVAAEHIQLGQRVAIKFLLPSALANPEAVSRFERESRAAVRLHSEHVARVIDVGKLPAGAPYMVIEFLEGVDLSQEIEKRRMLPVQEAVSYILQACDAIGEAHSLGIVHRDLKPANLFLAQRPGRSTVVKVLDFGISKTTSVGSLQASALTHTSAIMGSPLYMSPEQLRATRDVDARSDIWALGVTLYELLAGVTPFQAETVAELCVNILTLPPQPLRSRRNDVPPAIDAILQRCLEKDAAHRFSSIAELTQALQSFNSGSYNGPWPSRVSGETLPIASVHPNPTAQAASGSAVSSTASSLGAVGVTSARRSTVPSGKSIGIGLAAVGALVVMIVVAGIGVKLLRGTTATVTPGVTSSAEIPAVTTPTPPAAPIPPPVETQVAAPVPPPLTPPPVTAPVAPPVASPATSTATTVHRPRPTSSAPPVASATPPTSPATPAASTPRKKSPLDIGLQ